ncbi:hypothetical protein ACFTZ8_32845 [Streptomyces fungicidicus]|uniref:hypothetical protein n=1 Tax=Streptomyces fungicidicus TaxID=68203 RepID=UPI003634DB1D
MGAADRCRAAGEVVTAQVAAVQLRGLAERVQGLEDVGQQCPQLVGVLGQIADALLGGRDPAGCLVSRRYQVPLPGTARTAVLSSFMSGGAGWPGRVRMRNVSPMPR